jgi:hypothetical protein
MQINDLILHIRRLARRKTPTAASLLDLKASPYIMASAARYHYFRNSVAELATARGAELVEIEPGRLCLMAEDAGANAALYHLMELESDAWSKGPSLAEVLETFQLPEQYVELRERLESLQAGAVDRVEGAPGGEPDTLAGPLTPARLAQIENRLDGVDLEPFVRRQPVYRNGPAWQVVYTEQFTGLADLAAALFPKVEIVEGEPLFAELCRHLDRLMLVALLLNRPWRRQHVGLNLGHGAWSTDEYRRLLKCLDDAERGRLTIELHWLDALKDAAEGGRAMAEMREAGVTIAIDRIGIEALPLLNLERLDARWLKLVFDKSRLPLLLRADHVEVLRRCRPERLILANADDKLALDLGQKLGIAHYQGWLIDRLAKGEGATPRGPALAVA